MKNSRMLDSFGDSIFTKLANMKKAALAADKWVCDLSIGNPNIPPAAHIIEAGVAAMTKPESYKYAVMDSAKLQDAVATWYAARYGVTLDPRTQITSLLGSQEGLTHLEMALVDDEDYVLVPDPCYPAFADGVRIAESQIYYMEMKPENDYIIKLDEIPEDIAKKAKLMIVSYPNNPTAALAPDEFYLELIAFAKKYDIIVLHDNAYSDLVYDGNTAGSFLRFEGAMDVGIEFNSLSKTYGLAGARIGFCVGRADVVSAVKKLKSNMDYGMFMPIQEMAIAAITGDQTCVKETCAAYEARRNILCDGLNAIGWKVTTPPASMFAWTKIPEGFFSSMDFVEKLFDKTGVLMTPGSALGPAGEGYVRMGLVADEKTIGEAIEVMKNSGFFA